MELREVAIRNIEKWKISVKERFLWRNPTNWKKLTKDKNVIMRGKYILFEVVIKNGLY